MAPIREAITAGQEACLLNQLTAHAAVDRNHGPTYPTKSDDDADSESAFSLQAAKAYVQVKLREAWAFCHGVCLAREAQLASAPQIAYQGSSDVLAVKEGMPCQKVWHSQDRRVLRSASWFEA